MGKIPKEMLQATDRLYARYGTNYMDAAGQDDPDVKIILAWRAGLEKEKPRVSTKLVKKDPKSPMNRRKFRRMPAEHRYRYLTALKHAHPDWSEEKLCSWIGISMIEYWTYKSKQAATTVYKYLIFTETGDFINGYFDLDEIGRLYDVGKKTKHLTTLKAELKRKGYILRKR